MAAQRESERERQHFVTKQRRLMCCYLWSQCIWRHKGCVVYIRIPFLFFLSFSEGPYGCFFPSEGPLLGGGRIEGSLHLSLENALNLQNTRLWGQDVGGELKQSWGGFFFFLFYTHPWYGGGGKLRGCLKESRQKILQEVKSGSVSHDLSSQYLRLRFKLKNKSTFLSLIRTTAAGKASQKTSPQLNIIKTRMSPPVQTRAGHKGGL